MRSILALAATAALVAACGDRGGEGGGQGGGAQPQTQAGGKGGARDYVWAVGSSTVFPFATRAAETWQRKNQGAAPKVESLGTGGGIKLFCSGVGPGTPDIANASRRMKASEFEQCAQNGVNDIVELKIGYDGIVIAGAPGGPAFDLKPGDLYRGLAAELPAQGAAFAPNRATTWREVNPALPAQRILVYGPPPTSGTRDAFVELALEKGAGDIPAMAALKKSDEDQFKQRAGRIREDGAWVDAGENDNAIIGTLTKTPNSLGVFGYSFLENNRDQVRAASINGVQPNTQTISDGSYPLSRSLYIYVKKAHLDSTPGLRQFTSEFVSDAAAGPQGYLRDRGLIPLPQSEHDAVKQAAGQAASMAKPEK